MENLNVIDITCNLLKEYKIKYNLDEDFFELFLGDLQSFIQFEKLETDLDYTCAQFFITGTYDTEDVYHEDIDNNNLILTKSLIEESIIQLKDTYSTLNKGINKIELLINKISDIKEEYNIPYYLILNLINDQINDF